MNERRIFDVSPSDVGPQIHPLILLLRQGKAWAPISTIPECEKFVQSAKWKEVRSEFFSKTKLKCVKCGSTNQLQADHIKPKSKYPHLALDVNNLQVLCWPCNKSKGIKESGINERR